MKAALDKLTNLAMLVACCVVSVTLIHRWTVASPLGVVAYTSGQTFERVQGIDFAQAPNTLVMYVRSTCHFCTDSMPLYQQIAASASHGGGRFRIVVLTSEDVPTTSAYLREHSVAVDKVIAVESGETRFTATPTLVLVDPHGVVKQEWDGRLQDRRAAELLRALGINPA